MALKDKWKDAGKGIGHAFKNFGKAMATTTKVALGKEENVDEEGKSVLKESWKTVGHGFGDAGKGLGVAAAGTIEKAVGEEKKEGETSGETVEAKVEEFKEDAPKAEGEEAAEEPKPTPEDEAN